MYKVGKDIVGGDADTVAVLLQLVTQRNEGLNVAYVAGEYDELYHCKSEAE